MNNHIRAWRESFGQSLQEVADAVHSDKTQISKLERGARKVTVEWLTRLARHWGVTVEDLLQPPKAGAKPGVRRDDRQSLRMIPVVGRVAAGVWLEHEPDAHPEQSIPIALPGYERAKLFALRVEGTSMNLHYPEGSFVICCPAQESGIRHGDHVIVERRRNGLVETTIKELVIEGGKNWLWPRSSDPKHQTAWELVRHPESQNGMAITGVVVSAYSVRGRGTGPVLE